MPVSRKRQAIQESKQKTEITVIDTLFLDLMLPSVIEPSFQKHASTIKITANKISHTFTVEVLGSESYFLEFHGLSFPSSCLTSFLQRLLSMARKFNFEPIPTNVVVNKQSELVIAKKEFHPDNTDAAHDFFNYAVINARLHSVLPAMQHINWTPLLPHTCEQVVDFMLINISKSNVLELVEQPSTICIQSQPDID